MVMVSDDRVTERRGRWWVTVAAGGLALAFAAPVWSGTAARAALPKSDQARWVQRVRLVWRAHAHFWDHPRAEQQAAEKALLSEGKARAAAALKPMLARPLEDPLRLQAGFAAALLNLDYAAGRETLLRYLRSVRSLASGGGPVGVDWARLKKAVADPEASEYERHVGDWWEFPYFVEVVYKRQGDPKLLAGLLDLAPYADGESAEGMAIWLHEVARDNPRALVVGLQHQPQKVWQSVSELIGDEVAASGSGVPVQHALPKLYQLSRATRDPLHVPAERLLRGIIEGQKAG